MEKSTILTADVLDIIFDGRNKDYGAYDLRKTYQKRLLTSLSVMLSVIGIAIVAFAFTGKKEKEKVIDVKDFVLSDFKEPEKKLPEVTPPPPPKATPPPVQAPTMKFVAPVIVADKDVTEADKPPVVDDLNNVKIGDKNIKGDGDADIIAPPTGAGEGNVIEIPKREEEDWNKVFTKVEIESEYPGGPAAWQRFLHKNLRYPQDAVDNGVSGFVMVQFIVDKDGNVSNVEAISGPEELRAEAVRVIKKSGQWTAAVQNGNKVKSYKKQSIGFRLDPNE